MIPTWKVTDTPESVKSRNISPEEKRRFAVARAAYLIWIENGSRHGGDLDDWLQAEREYEANNERR